MGIRNWEGACAMWRLSTTSNHSNRTSPFHLSSDDCDWLLSLQLPNCVWCSTNTCTHWQQKPSKPVEKPAQSRRGEAVKPYCHASTAWQIFHTHALYTWAHTYIRTSHNALCANKAPLVTVLHPKHSSSNLQHTVLIYICKIICVILHFLCMYIIIYMHVLLHLFIHIITYSTYTMSHNVWCINKQWWPMYVQQCWLQQTQQQLEL